MKTLFIELVHDLSLETCSGCEALDSYSRMDVIVGKRIAFVVYL